MICRFDNCDLGAFEKAKPIRDELNSPAWKYIHKNLKLPITRNHANYITRFVRFSADGFGMTDYSLAPDPCILLGAIDLKTNEIKSYHQLFISSLGSYEKEGIHHEGCISNAFPIWSHPESEDGVLYITTSLKDALAYPIINPKSRIVYVKDAWSLYRMILPKNLKKILVLGGVEQEGVPDIAYLKTTLQNETATAGIHCEWGVPVLDLPHDCGHLNNGFCGECEDDKVEPHYHETYFDSWYDLVAYSLITRRESEARVNFLNNLIKQV